MNKEKHVPTLATCKRMKELGWVKNTMFYRTSTGVVYCPTHCKDGFNDYGQKVMFSAYDIPLTSPTLSEILEELPKGTISWDNEKYEGYDVNHPEVGGFGGLDIAEQAALLWCKLRAENIIPLPKENEEKIPH